MGYLLEISSLRNTHRKCQSPPESGEIRQVARKWCENGNCFGNCQCLIEGRKLVYASRVTPEEITEALRAIPVLVEAVEKLTVEVRSPKEQNRQLHGTKKELGGNPARRLETSREPGL